MTDDDQSIYWDALKRIVSGKPQIVAPNQKISFDLVALEANRGRGSLKANRLQHKAIREAVVMAAQKQLADTPKTKKAVEKVKLNKHKDDASHFQKLYEEAIGREIMLLKYIDTLEQENAELKRPRIVFLKK